MLRKRTRDTHTARALRDGPRVAFGLTLLALLLAGSPAFAEEAAAAAVANETETLTKHINWLWTVIAACLVFLMQAGFAYVEAGMVRAKNLINIMMKNLADLSLGTIGFWAVGFGLMFSGDVREFFPNPDVNSYGEDPNWMYAFILFQAVFAATAATIVSGAMAERTKFGAYLILSVIITTLIYPTTGSWAWGGLWHGGGWLESRGFVDFAGSTVVHSVGGWAALAGAIVVGPRIGKFNKDGSANALPAHNMGMATLGMLILWFGWFGFNAGSTTSMDDGNFARIALVTTLAASSGGLTAMLTNWSAFKYPDLSMTINGALAGLVSITAGCYTMTPLGAILVGGLGGVIVIFSILGLQKLRVDDPVGAVSVHGVCGAWGTLACAIPVFCRPGEAASFVTQLTGVAAVFAFVFGASLIMFFVIKKTIGLRVTEEEELKGLDLFEHGGTSYFFDPVD
jgi:Amt family ammonium transporter